MSWNVGKNLHYVIFYVRFCILNMVVGGWDISTSLILLIIFYIDPTSIKEEDFYPESWNQGHTSGLKILLQCYK